MNPQKFKKQTCGSSEAEPAQVQNLDANYTNYNQTYNNQTDRNQIHQSEDAGQMPIREDVMDITAAYLKLIKDNIGDL